MCLYNDREPTKKTIDQCLKRQMHPLKLLTLKGFFFTSWVTQDVNKIPVSASLGESKKKKSEH